MLANSVLWPSLIGFWDYLGVTLDKEFVWNEYRRKGDTEYVTWTWF